MDNTNKSISTPPLSKLDFFSGEAIFGMQPSVDFTNVTNNLNEEEMILLANLSTFENEVLNSPNFEVGDQPFVTLIDLQNMSQSELQKELESKKNLYLATRDTFAQLTEKSFQLDRREKLLQKMHLSELRKQEKILLFNQYTRSFFQIKCSLRQAIRHMRKQRLFIAEKAFLRLKYNMTEKQLGDHYTSLRVLDRLGLETLGKVAARVSSKLNRQTSMALNKWRQVVQFLKMN